MDDVTDGGDAADHLLVVVLDDPGVGPPPLVQLLDARSAAGSEPNQRSGGSSSEPESTNRRFLAMRPA